MTKVVNTEDNVVDIKDYGLFSSGVASTKKLNEALGKMQTIVTNSKKVLEDAEMFLGPMATSADEGLKELFKRLETMVSNFSEVESYLINASETYQSSDKNAAEVLRLNKNTGKVEVQKGVYGADYKATSSIHTDYEYYFINKIKDFAIESYNETGVLPSITIAQAIHESGWGKKGIDGNIFGIKTGTNWTGTSKNTATQEFVNGSYIDTNADFRTYTPERQEGETDQEYRERQWYMSTMDHGYFLAGKDRYKNVITATDYETAARELKKAVYATGEHYDDHIIETIKMYDLAQWDPTPEEKNQLLQQLATNS